MSQILNATNILLTSVIVAAVVHRVYKFAIMLQTPNTTEDGGLELEVFDKSEIEYVTDALPPIVITPPSD